MPSGGNTYDKYQSKRRTDGRLCLEDPVDDQICRMLAEGDSHEEIVALMGIEQARIDTVLLNPLGQRRIKFLTEQQDNEPTSDDERLNYAKSKLWSMSKNGDIKPRDRISALGVLAKLAQDGLKNKPPVDMTPKLDLEAMKKAFNGESNDT